MKQYCLSGTALAVLAAVVIWARWPSPRPARAASPPLERRASLLSLGYLEFTDAGKASSGVIHRDVDRSWQGYNLHTSRNLCRATLTDHTGVVVRRWSHPGRHWARAELTDRGELIVVGSDVDGRASGTPQHELGAYWRFSWDGELLAKARVSAHHDIELTPDGRVLLLTSRLRTEPEIFKDGPVVEDWLTLLDIDGTPIDGVSLVDVLRQPIDGFALQPMTPWRIDGQMRMDLTHANSVEWMARPQLFGTHPVYGKDHVLICMRHQNAIAVIDFASKRLVWAWGQDELEGPHDATLLDSGNILLLDNGVTRGSSRAVEVDPRTRSIVWQYPPPGGTPFFTLSMGAAQRLPNGNTLITDSNHSRAFEVTPEGQTVWEYVNPDLNDLGMRSVITSMTRYPTEWVEAIVRRQAESRKAGESGNQGVRE